MKNKIIWMLVIIFLTTCINLMLISFGLTLIDILKIYGCISLYDISIAIVKEKIKK